MVLTKGTHHTMALDQSALLEVLDALKGADVEDRIRQAATTIYQALIETELTSVIGAAPHERTEGRSGYGTGTGPRRSPRPRVTLQLQIPKLRTGSFFPSLLERRRRVNQSLFAVIMEAYLHGTSTCKVDDLVKALGADTGISKSEVSRICAGLDVEVAADGRREVLGFDVGDSEDGAFWTAFLRTLKTRGLHGVQLVISDAHADLKAAIEAVLLGAPGSAAGCNSCATFWRRFPKAMPRWSRPRSAPSSPNPTRSMFVSN
jgi:putative transposase